MTAVGVVSVGVPTVVASIGRLFYWCIEWVVAVPWRFFEKAKGLTTNLPWPKGRTHERIDEPPKEYLLVILKDSDEGKALAKLLGPKNDKVVPDEALDELTTQEMAQAY